MKIDEKSNLVDKMYANEKITQNSKTSIIITI